MFSITISFGAQASMWVFMFRDETRARNTFAQYKEAPPFVLGSNPGPDVTHFTIVDDFGQTGCFIRTQINGAIVEDIEQSALLHVDRIIQQGHIQASAQQRAAADPKLRMAGAMRGPSMLQPGMNGRGS